MTTNPDLTLDIPDKLIPLFKSEDRYQIAYGGRGGGKSWTFSDKAIIKGYQRPLFFPCLRQFQVSIQDSVHRLLSQSIEKMNLGHFFKIYDNIISGLNGTEFVFKGLARNINNIKSLEGADIVWITEATDVTEEAWKKLIPTIRKNNSQIWLDFNPEEIDDPTFDRFVTKDPAGTFTRVKINYYDNPFFPETLRDEMEYCKEYNPEDFENIWLGECVTASEAQIMRDKWEVKEFDTPKDAVFYYGSDWGNSGLNDPDVIVRCFVEDGYLYIDEEVYGNVREIEDYIPFYNSMPGAKKWRIRCDNTMEKFRIYINNHGYDLINAEKGPGSVESGIKFLRSFKRIFIHPRCKHSIFEFKNYKYKVDPRTGEVLKIIIDKHNHVLDSIRYSVEPINTNEYASITTW